MKNLELTVMHRRAWRMLPAALVFVLLAGCAQKAAGAVALFYVDQEKGAGESHTRMVVTPQYLRIDDGRDGNDFLLFDRRDRTIYSVNSTDRQILVIGFRSLTLASPIALAPKEERDRRAFPAIGGKTVTHYRLLANGSLCYDLYAAEDLLPQAVAALREYREALAGQQGVTLASAPKEFQTPCDLANNVFMPVRYLEHGLPVRFTDMTGKVSELVDYRTDFKAPASLFALPAEYRRIELKDGRMVSGE